MCIFFLSEDTILMKMLQSSTSNKVSGRKLDNMVFTFRNHKYKFTEKP